MRVFKPVRSGTAWAVAEVMDCGGNGKGPDRNWRMVGCSCATEADAEKMAQFWRARTAMPEPKLETFVVAVHFLDWSIPTMFKCQAEDEQHAFEQAADAYPGYNEMMLAEPDDYLLA